ncbi:MAG: DUF3899 domain-containing protein [Clostridia bacterium]|nr:DUF3899 domain-containing protein [Clostridia bacterium]
MKPENKSLLKKFLICFGIAAAIVFIVIWIKGFFTDNASSNIAILADAFFVSGILFTLFAGMLFVSGEGALIGIGFVLRNVLLAFIPMGRAKHELYADYRERKLGGAKQRKYNFVLITGLIFLSVGIIFTIIWSSFYNSPSV